MASVLRAATANEWWDSLNTVKSTLGLSTTTSNIADDNIAKYDAFNVYINNMNALSENTYARHADWITISAVADDTIIKQSYFTNIDTMLEELNTICPNAVSATGGLSTSFSVIQTGTSTDFSVTSFSKTLNCSRNGNNANFSDASDCSRCSRRTGISSYSNTGCSFSTSNSRTAFGTESGFNGQSNTSNTNRSNQANNSQSANSNFSDFGTNGTSNTNNSRASNTNFTRFTEALATPCDNTATTNAVTVNSNVYAGFAVRGT